MRGGLDQEFFPSRVKMSKVTSKLQLTLPRPVAERKVARVLPTVRGTLWEPSGDAIRVTKLARTPKPGLDVHERLRRFDQATRRQETRNAAHRRERRGTRAAEGRGWSREDLYGRGRPRRDERPRLPIRPAIPREAADRDIAPARRASRRVAPYPRIEPSSSSSRRRPVPCATPALSFPKRRRGARSGNGSGSSRFSIRLPAWPAGRSAGPRPTTSHGSTRISGRTPSTAGSPRSTPSTSGTTVSTGRSAS